MRIHEEISKINAEIVKKLGERVSVNYIISGERGEKWKIKYKFNKRIHLSTSLNNLNNKFNATLR